MTRRIKIGLVIYGVADLLASAAFGYVIYDRSMRYGYALGLQKGYDNAQDALNSRALDNQSDMRKIGVCRWAKMVADCPFKE